MARIVTKQHAIDIAKKLKATAVQTRRQSAHQLYAVHEHNVLIATFGIRRASEKDKGHDHIPKQLFVGPKDARDLAQCPLSREQWIQKLKVKGKI